MKKIGYIIFFLAIPLLFALSVNASEIDGKITSSLEDELADFKNTLPDSVIDFLPENTLSGDYTQLLNGSIDEISFLELTATYLTSGINVVLKSFASILILIIIISVFNAMSSAVTNDGLKLAFSLCSCICITVTVFNICSVLVNNAAQYMSVLCTVMSAFIPIMTATLTMGGNITGAVVSNGSMLLFINLVEGFLVSFMLPLTKAALAFGCVKGLNSEIDLGGISKSIKTAFTSVTVFVMSIFMFVLSYKNTLAQGADTISIKTARFAISSFVPLVGSSVNESLRTVTASLSLIKSSCGIVAIISVAVLMLPIIINLFLNKLSFSLLATMSRAIGGNKEAAVLEEADSACGFILTLVCCTCVLFIFALTIFIKTELGGTS